MTFSASVDIRADAAEVFPLVSDLRRKARLNPGIEVIRIELLGGEPVREGSVFRHRFAKGGRIIEYRSRCVWCVPPRLFETRGETDPPFEVHVTVEPTPAGCRLTQRETVAIPPELLDVLDTGPAPARTFRDIVRLLPLFPSARHLGSELWALQRERVARRLSGELETWLDAIRAHAEAAPSRGLGGVRQPLGQGESG
ncbi:MAG: SRPBCC family protein [Candidatus Rokubacteria bacterium]|nr:SRPBCC family protein [Candidatus Rokubacteria bacterium]